VSVSWPDRVAHRQLTLTLLALLAGLAWFKLKVGTLDAVLAATNLLFVNMLFMVGCSGPQGRSAALGNVAIYMVMPGVIVGDARQPQAGLKLLLLLLHGEVMPDAPFQKTQSQTRLKGYHGPAIRVTCAQHCTARQEHSEPLHATGLCCCARVTGRPCHRGCTHHRSLAQGYWHQVHPLPPQSLLRHSSHVETHTDPSRQN
jgi:hypothetical protein